MRPKTLVAGAALTASLVLVAAPGLAGSRTPEPYTPVPAAAFQALETDATERSTASIEAYDPALNAAGHLLPITAFAAPGSSLRPAPVISRNVQQPDPGAIRVYKPAKYSLTGKATFYGAGSTAMRLPRGTVVRVCGAAGCLERVITDYGPTAGTDRIIDLYRPDFFKICGCPSWSGVTPVTVYVY